MTPPAATATPSILSRCAYFLAASVLSLSLVTSAQDTPPQTVEEALHQISDSAAIIFTGEVIAIRSLPGQNGASGVVEVDFRVEQAVRGTTAGSIFTLHEWAGLWAGGEPRYRTGQRLLMLLHAPGPSGITSPVGDMAGAIPIRATSSAPQAASASTTTTPLIADLRWVGTLLHRSTLPNSTPLAAASSSPTQTSTPSQPPDASVAAQQAPISVVVGMLRSWQQATQP